MSTDEGDAYPRQVLAIADSGLLRSKVINILAGTANGCLSELGYNPGVLQRVAHLEQDIAQHRTDNAKLFEDNQHLARSLHAQAEALKHLSGPEAARIETIRQLQAQVARLSSERTDLLRRNEALMASAPVDLGYQRLLSDYQELSRQYQSALNNITYLQRFVYQNTNYGRSVQSPSVPQPSLRAVGASQSQPLQNSSQLVPMAQHSQIRPPSAAHSHMNQVTQYTNLSNMRRASEDLPAATKLTHSKRRTSDSTFEAYSGQQGPPPPSGVRTQYIHTTMPAIVQHDSIYGPTKKNSQLGPIHVAGWSPIEYHGNLSENPRPYRPRLAISSNTITYPSRRDNPPPLAGTAQLPTPISAQAPPPVAFPHDFIPSQRSQLLTPPTSADLAPLPGPGALPPQAALPMYPTPVSYPPISTLHGGPHYPTLPVPRPASRMSATPSELVSALTSLKQEVVDTQPQAIPLQSLPLPPKSPNIPEPAEAVTPLDTGHAHIPVTSLLKSPKRPKSHITEHPIGDSEVSRKKPRLEEPINQEVYTKIEAAASDEQSLLYGEYQEEDEPKQFGPDGLRLEEDCLSTLMEHDPENEGVVYCQLCHARYELGYATERPKPFENPTQDELVQHCLAEHFAGWEALRRGD